MNLESELEYLIYAIGVMADLQQEGRFQAEMTAGRALCTCINVCFTFTWKGTALLSIIISEFVQIKALFFNLLIYSNLGGDSFARDLNNWLNRPFSKMAAENLNKSKLKTNTSTRKSTLTLVNLPSLSISGEITAEKMYVENWKIYRRLYDWGYNAYPQSYKRL